MHELLKTCGSSFINNCFIHRFLFRLILSETLETMKLSKVSLYEFRFEENVSVLRYFSRKSTNLLINFQRRPTKSNKYDVHI